jgi:Xaa-Pro aminopeptidase
MNKRLAKIKEYLKANSMDSLVVTDPKNMRYLASYTGEGYLVISQDTDYLVTDFRYITQAKEQTQGFEICDISSFKPKEEFGGFKRTLFEDASVSYATYKKLSESFASLNPLGSVLLDMRAVKDEGEISAIAKAEQIGDMAFSHILSFLKPGVSERDIALEIEFFMRKNGAEALSFDTIVATGAHGAMPHAEPDDRKIQSGDFVVLDFGCVYEGYSSDMTRTVCVGKASPEMKKIYNTVLKAQTTSLDMVKEGMIASDIHANAQRIIDEVYPKTFGHGLGHGVGLDIHESPNLSPRNPKPLQNGNVVTVEPGIYIDGFCGVRIEDLVVVDGDKCVNLTHSDKNLIEI